MQPEAILPFQIVLHESLKDSEHSIFLTVLFLPNICNDWLFYISKMQNIIPPELSPGFLRAEGFQKLRLLEIT